MQTQLVKIKDLKNNIGQIDGLPKNPRILKDDKFIKLKKSLEDDPEMLELREVIAYDNNGELIVICGNMRLKALKELGIKEVPTKILPAETNINKLKAYTIKDNVSFGDHDWEVLSNEWDVEQLEGWGLDIPSFEVEEVLESTKDDKEIEAIQKLEDKFIVPPFSILNAREGKWQERKRYWKDLIQDTGITRDTGNQTNTRYRSVDGFSASREGENVGSVLDPVLSEIIIKWFGLEKSKMFDCFSGDTVFGYV